ncbi:MAG: Hpt domain-containing protein, partial [Pseudomonadota bacterium]
MCKQIHNIAVNSDDPERAQRVSMDMAMALLLLSSGIEHYQNLGNGFHEQARILSLRLQEGMMRLPEDVTKLESLVSLYCEMEQREVISPLAIEMQNNLQHIEQYLNAIFSDRIKRPELTQINRLLSQVQGGLHILSLDVAEHLLSTLRQVTERYHNGELPSAKEMRTVADAISILGDYVHGLTLGQKPDPLALSKVLHDLEDAFASAGHSDAGIPEEVIVPPGVSIRSGDEDAELLEVFLEEAQEVMETLRANLDISRLHLDSREPWVTIRRAFHTLKGSGRMVGLTDLGEVAWAVERAMNKWLAENKQTTPAILEMVGDAEVLFQHWVDMLRSGSTTAHIDTTHLLTLADHIENGSALPLPAAADTATSEQAESPAEEALLQIGSVSIEPLLFRIASEEAAQLVRTLQHHLADLQEAEAAVVTFDFMRTAHTLAGVNRNMGFWSTAELAYALEQWLGARIDKSGCLNSTQIELIKVVIRKLDELCEAIRNHREPLPQPELIARLHNDNEVVANLEAIAVQTIGNEHVPAITLLPSKTESTSVARQEVERPTDEPLADIVSARKKQRVVNDEVDAQLLPIFLDEANELYPQIGSTLRAWRENPGDAQLGRNLQRSLHTLKGSARMAGAMRLGELTHRVEDRVSKSIVRNTLDDALWTELESYLDRIASAIDHLHVPQEDGLAEDEALPGTVTAASRVSLPATGPVLEVGAERAMQAALLRVRSDTVDRLVNEAGEISVARSRVEAELREFKISVLELSDSINRLRKQLR